MREKIKTINPEEDRAFAVGCGAVAFFISLIIYLIVRNI
jgi:hypothetical protein